jgi:hypothetical protein
MLDQMSGRLRVGWTREGVYVLQERDASVHVEANIFSHAST